MSQPTSADDVRSNHRLELETVELVNGGREVHFQPGFNIIQGDITSGKTTLVRLIGALLGPMSKNLAPEVDYLTAIRGRVALGNRLWDIYRPRTTTQTAPVEISEVVHGQSPAVFRLPVTSSGPSYGKFVLEQLGLPVVSVPQARNEPTGSLTPVSIRDWLNYCIITGDELDTQVFGHQRPWRQEKRKWVFELIYGYYDPDLAIMRAELRRLELRIQTLSQSAEINRRFLEGTPFSGGEDLDAQLAIKQSQLVDLIARRRAMAGALSEIGPGLAAVRNDLLRARTRQAAIVEQLGRVDAQITELDELERQLKAQSARLTRAIVADELLVDFDFVVCPRCGQNVSADRAEEGHCYLCLQEPRPAPSTGLLLAEQDRIAAQVSETGEVLADRRESRDQLTRQLGELEQSLVTMTRQLEIGSATFVSDRASQLEANAANQAALEADIRRLTEYQQLIQRYREGLEDRRALEAEADALRERINRTGLKPTDAEGNVRELETRFLEYLRELHIPEFTENLFVRINRTSYLPEVSGRSFDMLSSQGLKTLVNIAHALANHTVAVDRGLPLPGLLILDGISSNAGQEGFDLARIRDVYRLLARTAARYRSHLQIVAVDNEITRTIGLEFRDALILGLKQDDRLIRRTLAPPS